MVRSLKTLVGSGDKIGRLVLPVAAVGLALNLWRPAAFDVGGPPPALRALSIVMLLPGVTIWIWSVVLILTRVPKRELITNGPYALVRHPLYTAVGLLVLPSAGLLLDTWLGVLIGAVLYTASRMYSPEEERTLSETFGVAWDEYRAGVKIAWL